MRRGRIGIAAVLAVASAVLFTAPVHAQAGHTCGGLPATHVGTEGDDILIGTAGRDVIVGLGGNDIIFGLDGRDFLCGNGGRDWMFGGRQADTMFGGDKGDLMKGEAGADVIFGERGNDRLIGGNGDDELDGGGGNVDRLAGRGGNDLCVDRRATTRVSTCEIVRAPLLDFALPSNFMDFDRAPGFVPDPLLYEAVSGGPVDVSYLGPPCVGFATASPDFQITYGPGGAYLRIFFQADPAAGDTALVVNDPFGDWLCNDDFDGLDPAIELVDPIDGVYDIWIASYDPLVNHAGFLGITEFPPG